MVNQESHPLDKTAREIELQLRIDELEKENASLLHAIESWKKEEVLWREELADKYEKIKGLEGKAKHFETVWKGQYDACVNKICVIDELEKQLRERDAIIKKCIPLLFSIAADVPKESQIEIATMHNDMCSIVGFDFKD